MGAIDTVLAKYNADKKVRIFDALSDFEEEKFKTLEESFKHHGIYMTYNDLRVCEAEIFRNHGQ